MKGKTKGKRSENIQAAGLRFEPIRHNKAALKQLSVRHHLKDLAAGGRHPLQWQRHFCGFLIWPSQRNHQLLLTTLTTSAIAPLPRKHLATDSAPTPTHKAAGGLRICCVSVNQDPGQSRRLIFLVFFFFKCSKRAASWSGKARHSCYTINGLNHFLRERGEGLPRGGRVWSHPQMQEGGKKRFRLLLWLASCFSHTAHRSVSNTTQTLTSFGFLRPHIHFLIYLFLIHIFMSFLACGTAGAFTVTDDTLSYIS